MSEVGIVVIGRNEGERLRRCLRSVAGRGDAVVYVDSGSTDGSISLAQSFGATVVALDLSIPFTAARARNAGAERLLEVLPGVRFIQFIDGDCELDGGWLPAALPVLERRADAAVICGRRREFHPEASIYNRLADMEWNTPIGEAKACGGDALMRVEPYRDAGGYDPTLIAGEEPEFCSRLRAAGWVILRIDADMTRHDLNMTRFGQSWTRAVRNGYGGLRVTVKRSGAGTAFARQVRSAWAWTIGWVLLLAASAATWAICGPAVGVPLVVAVALLPAIQAVRIAVGMRRRAGDFRTALAYGAVTMIHKWAELAGHARFCRDRLHGGQARLIEYKAGGSTRSKGKRTLREAVRDGEAGPVLGYLGVDVLNNATVCNEASALLRSGVPMRVVSVYPHRKATFYDDESLGPLRDAITDLYPLRAGEVAGVLALAPFRFGFRLFSALMKAVFAPAEGVRERLVLLWQFLPAIVLASRWRDQKIGHIHAHWAHTATSIAMHAAHLLGVGFSFTGHANDIFVHRIALVSKLRRARFVVCISGFHRQYYLGLGASPDRLPVVYCGIDGQRFRPPSPCEGAGEAPPRIVTVGRLVEKKGFDDLVSACGILRDRGVDFDCIIAGSGPMEVALRDQVDRLGLGDRVVVTALTVMQEDLPNLLRSARVFALPCVRDRDGDMDGLPQVLIEAMMVARPCVSTDLVGIPDLVIDGRTGLLVGPRDPRDLADAIESLLRDPARADRLGREAERWARAHFSLGETVSRLRALFEGALVEPGSAPPAIRLDPASLDVDSEPARVGGPLRGAAAPLVLPPAAYSPPVRDAIA